MSCLERWIIIDGNLELPLSMAGMFCRFEEAVGSSRSTKELCREEGKIVRGLQRLPPSLFPRSKSPVELGKARMLCAVADVRAPNGDCRGVDRSATRARLTSQAGATAAQVEAHCRPIQVPRITTGDIWPALYTRNKMAKKTRKTCCIWGKPAVWGRILGNKLGNKPWWWTLPIRRPGECTRPHRRPETSDGLAGRIESH